jgi:hypothetical protein
VGEFIRLVESGRYEQVYGDIPQRPMFLRFILDSVSVQGVQSVGRAGLLYNWARMKTHRDVALPRRWGREGREPIVAGADSADATIQLAVEAMIAAARAMTQRHGRRIELLPDCALDEVLGAVPALRQVADATGVYLNSLLLPVTGAQSISEPRVRFAHRIYQEFFLALDLYRRAEKSAAYPEPVQQHVLDIEQEGVVRDNNSN